MFQVYVNKLIENLPEEIKTRKKPVRIDLVLDGGIFNGSYLVGALYFLKEMENRNYIKIERISGCSVGSLAAFFYFIDRLDLITDLYRKVYSEFKENYNLNIIAHLKKYVHSYIPENICSRINHRLFVCYYNMKKNKKCIKSVYRNADDVIYTIIKSCSIPYLIDGKLLFKDTFMDGINPYVFPLHPHKKILYLDLFGYDKIGNLLNIKNEKTNCHRILSGLLDIYCFFIKQSSTPMCSFLEEWSYSHLFFHSIKIGIERICVLLVHICVYISHFFPNPWKGTLLYKIVSIMSYDVFVVLLETYCL
jgi:hypothetical protein